MKSQAKIDANETTKKRVFVGISGGVDSSVSAALLQKAGYDVTGVFIKVWQPDWLECTWREERRDAMRVAAHLDIPFVMLDLEKEYKKEVVDYMIAEYKAGRTPNPDVMCNKSVKFGAFYDWAMMNGADYVATGHYAQIIKRSVTPVGGDSLHRRSEATSEGDLLTPKGCVVQSLCVSADVNKDQTYFLWTLHREQLPRVLFPIGHLTKPEVRKLAKKLKLPTVNKKDSQGLCFIGMVDMKEFLSHYIEAKRGIVLDLAGKIIGEHDGAFLYTIGERHGFTITRKSPNDKPLYVISKNIETNTITVSTKTVVGELPNSRRQVSLKDTNWNQGMVPIGKNLKARSRYREELQEIIMIDDMAVKFAEPQGTLSAGQSMVVYDGAACLGGGIIV